MSKELILLFVNRFNCVSGIPFKTIEEQWKDQKLVNLSRNKIFQVFIACKNSPLFFFTNTGKVYRIDSNELIGTRNIFVKEDHCFVELSSFKKIIKKNGEEQKEVESETHDIQIVSVISKTDLNQSQDLDLLLVTKNGICKKLETEHLKNVNNFGRKIITLCEGDELIEVKVVNDNSELVLISSDGRAVKFSSSDLRELGRNATGVRGINLKTPYLGGKDYELSFATTNREGNELLIIGEKGYGKRIQLELLPLVQRGNKKGVVCHSLNASGWITYASCISNNSNLIGWTRRNYLHKIEVNSIFHTDKRYSRGDIVLKDNTKVYDSLVGVIKY